MSTTFSDGTRVPGTRRNEALFRELRPARAIKASGKARRRDYGRAAGQRAQKRPRVQLDNAVSSFGFARMLDVLGRLMPMGSKGVSGEKSDA